MTNTAPHNTSDLPEHAKSRWFKWLKFFFLTLLVLLVLVIGLAYYLLGTTSGLKQSIGLINRFTAYQVKVDTISGQLLGQTELTHLDVSSEQLQFRSDRVLLNWQPKALFDKSLTVHAIHVENSVLRLSEGKQKNEKQPAHPLNLVDINLPIDIQLESLKIDNFVIENPITEKPLFVVDEFILGVDYQGQIGDIKQMYFVGEGVTANLSGSIETRGDFPLNITNETDYSSERYGEQQLDIDINGELKNTLTLNITGHGISDFSFNGSVKELLSSPTFVTDVKVEKTDFSGFGYQKTVATADLHVDGQFDKHLALQSYGTVNYNSPETDALRLTFESELNDHLFTLSNVVVKLLTAKQQLNGKGHYHLNDKTLALDLFSEVLQWPQHQPNPDVLAKQVKLNVTGQLDDYYLTLNADTESVVAGQVPIAMTANGSTQALKSFITTLMIDEAPLTLAGKATWLPTLGYQFAATADSIKPQHQLPGIKGLNLLVNGDDATYQAKGKLHVYADHIPPSDIHLAVVGTPKQLEQGDLLINTLGGQVIAAVSGGLDELDIHADIVAKAVQPQRFYPQINGNINTTLSLSATRPNNQLLINAAINEISGKLQNQPLAGQGKIVFDQAAAQLTLDRVDIDLAGNTVKADGLLALATKGGNSNLRANIDAKYLKRLLPGLSGAVVADIHAQGDIQSPQLSGNLRGDNLAYQKHQINAINATFDIDFPADKLAINAIVNQANLSGNVVEKARITADGQLSAHQLTAMIKAPNKATIPILNLRAQGGFDRQALTWSGKVSKLTIDQAQAGKWSLQQPTALILAADNVVVDKLCLQQQKSSVCADGQLQGKNAKFDVQVNQLDTRQYAHLLPQSLQLQTVINGKAKIKLIDGQPDLVGRLSANGGRLQYSGENGSNLDSPIKQLQTTFALKNNRLDTEVTGELTKIGKVNFNAVLPNVGQSNELQTTVKINSESLDFIEELVPMLSNVDGKISGEMTLSGIPGKSVNVAGKITLHKTDFDVPQFGTRIRDLTLDIFAKKGNQIGFKGSANGGDGRFNIDGTLNPNNRQGEIHLKGQNFQVANSRKIKIAISPDLKIIFADQIKIRGDILIPKALIVPTSGQSKITVSEDVVLPDPKLRKQAASSPIDVEVNVKLGDDVRVASNDIETRLLGSIKVIAKPGKVPIADGVISIRTGELRVYGQMLNIQRGRVIFSGGPIANPGLDVRASRDIDGKDIIVGVNVLGHVQRPEISLFSTPSMPDSSILSYLLFGRPPSSDTFGTAALLQTGGLVGANTLARDLRDATGLDVLDFSLTGVEAGKNLTKKIYIGVRNSFFDSINEFLVKYKISSQTHVDVVTSAEGISADLIKEIETD